MFFLGDASGHDFEFHLNSWMEVQRQWTLGTFYPRWAGGAHYGYGEARFLFYPPASWMLGAALGAVLAWAAAPEAFIWLALTLAGWSLFTLARRWLSRRDALFAAALYAASPYHLVIVYWRSAVAELLASALLPVLLLWVLRIEEEGSRAAVPLSLIVAAAWLTNAPSAVMVNYSLALLVVVVGVIRRSGRVLVYGAAAVIVGAALAGFYLVPAAYEERWVNIAEVLSPGVRPRDNFLFTLTGDPDHNRFNYLVSLVAYAEIVFLVASAWLTRRAWNVRRELWTVLVAWSAVAATLTTRFTVELWEHLPKLRFVQLPWRWLLCLNVALSILVILAWRRWVMRAVAYAVMLCMIWFVWHGMQPPWWDTAADIAEMHENLWHGNGYEGTDEYVPTGADPYEIKQDAPLAVVAGEGSARVKVEEWDPQAKKITAEVSRPENMVLRLFNFPAWTVRVNGKPVVTETTAKTGQMVVPLEAGVNQVQIRFGRTWDRAVGGVVSFCGLVVLGAATWRKRAKIRRA